MGSYRKALPKEPEMDMSVLEDLKVKYAEIKDNVEVQLKKLTQEVDVIVVPGEADHMPLYKTHRVDLLQQINDLQAQTLSRLRPAAATSTPNTSVIIANENSNSSSNHTSSSV